MYYPRCYERPWSNRKTASRLSMMAYVLFSLPLRRANAVCGIIGGSPRFCRSFQLPLVGGRSRSSTMMDDGHYDSLFHHKGMVSPSCRGVSWVSKLRKGIMQNQKLNKIYQKKIYQSSLAFLKIPISLLRCEVIT